MDPNPPTVDTTLPHLTRSYDDHHEVRAKIEEEFNRVRLNNEAEHQRMVEVAAQRLSVAHARNEEARQDALREAGLNPDGSDPQDRPMGSLI